jgi:hypothetical protein
MKRILFLTAVVLIAFSGVAWGAASITGKNIKNGSVTGKDIKNHSLSGKDFSGSVRGSAGATGATGPRGVNGATGAKGATGVAKITVVRVQVSEEETGIAFAFCPAGSLPISGGGIAVSTYLWASVMVRDDNTGKIGWAAAANPGDTIAAYAYCSTGVSAVSFPTAASSAQARGAQAQSLGTVADLRAAAKVR